jgi:hypothetical protein
MTEVTSSFKMLADIYQIACYHNPKVCSLNTQTNPTYLDFSLKAYTTCMIPYTDAYYKIHITRLCMWIYLEINRESKIFTMYSTLQMFLLIIRKCTFQTLLTGLKTDGKISACQRHFSKMPFS